MAANIHIPGKTITVLTVGTLLSNRVTVIGYFLWGTAATASRTIIVEKSTGKQVIGGRPGPGVPVWVGPAHAPFNGLSCSVCSNGGAVTLYYE